MDVVLKSVVKSFHHVVFVNQGTYNLLVVLQSLQHVKPELEGWFIVSYFSCTFGPKLNKYTSQFERVVKDMELKHLMQLSVLSRLK